MARNVCESVYNEKLDYYLLVPILICSYCVWEYSNAQSKRMKLLKVEEKTKIELREMLMESGLLVDNV